MRGARVAFNMRAVAAVCIIYFKKCGVEPESSSGGLVEAVYIPENKRGAYARHPSDQYHFRL
jgi:hypothetical protein